MQTGALATSILLVMAIAPALGGELLPDPSLTPGAVLDTSVETICQRGYARAHRVWHSKWDTLAKYGIARNQSALYEDDDLVPVCLGGDNANPLNHWPQPRGVALGAEVKDDLEWAVCRKVCRDRDDGELATYQRAFARDWIALLRSVGAR